ncbi:MAG: PAS domain S-box protein [Candidatus Eisenbacteria bacterium]|nr:PAS domain S-box protein [Candidatus Eisenbacteria bacterium]
MLAALIEPVAPRDRSRTGALLVRGGILALTGCMTLLGPHHPGAETAVSLLVVVGVALTLVERFALRRFGESAEITAHYVGDVGLLTAALVLGGDLQGQFAPIYLLVVAAAGSAAGMGGGLTCGTLAALAYPATLWLTHPRGADVDWPRATVLSLVFLSVGALAGTLGQRSREHRTALEDAHRRLHRMQLDTACIVRNMSSGLMTADLEGRIGICNPAAEEILGLAPGGAAGRILAEALPPGVRPFRGILDAAILAGVVHQRAEVDIVRGSGSEIPLGISTSLLREPDGRRRGVVAVFQDLTEARERARRARRQETLAGIGELAAGVAHEIRNCLNPITGSIELLKTEFRVDGEGGRLMDLITHEGERLNQFIAELLDFARMEELRPGPVDLGALLEETARLLECHPKRRPDHQVRCEIATPCWARVDGEQLKRVFVNLGVNALEATDGPGTLMLRLDTAAPGGRRDEVAIVFEDEGQGIREDHLPHVFEPFFTTKRGGTGLGLSLARQVVERHGGHISARSEGRGTRMSVTLPLEEVATPPARAA